MHQNQPEIKLLCPPKKCGKCRRLINRVDSVLKELDISKEIQIVNDLEEIQQYPTWVLPTLIINGEMIARGYVPSKEEVQSALGKLT